MEGVRKWARRVEATAEDLGGIVVIVIVLF